MHLNFIISRCFKVLRCVCALHCVHYYCGILLIQDEKKEELLNGLQDGFLSFADVEEKSEQLKALTTTKKMFMKEVELLTWEEAEALLPAFTDQNILKKFNIQKGKPLPKDFKVSLIANSQ